MTDLKTEDPAEFFGGLSQGKIPLETGRQLPALRTGLAGGRPGAEDRAQCQ